MYKRCFKRVLDLLLSLFGLVILSVPMLVVALIIKIDSPGPVFFFQKRVGIHKTYFNMPKFRTMHTNAPPNMPTHLLAQPDQWITRSGRWLRKLSLDELPQIFSIVIGKMGVIGPRPALWNQDDLIAARERYGANDIRPGLTGWAQINGRDELSIEVKAKFDGEYVEKMGFLFDCKCFFGTMIKVFRRDGIVEGKSAKEQKGAVIK